MRTSTARDGLRAALALRSLEQVPPADNSTTSASSTIQGRSFTGLPGDDGRRLRADGNGFTRELASRRSKKRRSGSCMTSASAHSYDARASAVRPSAEERRRARRAADVAGELAARDQRVDARETRGRTVAHRERHGAIQLDHGRGLHAEERS
jgi:hypothetical protein